MRVNAQVSGFSVPETRTNFEMGEVAAAQNASRMFRDCLLQNLWDD
jgi:hypothetical protein